MKTITLDNLKNIDLQGIIGVIANKQLTDRKYFVVLESIKVKLSNGYVVTIPKDFSFDGSSTPKLLEWLFPRYGAFIFAALIHDWLYVTDYLRDDIGMRDAQLFADKEMLTWSLKMNNKSIFNNIDNYIRYYTVRLFGKSVYKRRNSKYK